MLQPFSILIFHNFLRSSSSDHFEIFHAAFFLRQGLSDGACGPFDESLRVARSCDPGDSQGAAAVQRSRLYVVGLAQVVEVLAGQVELLRVGLVRQHDLAPELGGDHLGVDHVPVLPGDVAPHRVIPGE